MNALTSSPGRILADAKGVSIIYKDSPFIQTQGLAFAPRFAEGAPPAPAQTDVARSSVTYTFKSGPVQRLKTSWRIREGHFEIQAEALMAADATLTEWRCFGSDGALAGFDQVAVANVNTNGRLTSGVFDRFRLGGHFQRVSHAMGMGLGSWFFPLPVNYILARYSSMLFLGLDSVGDFSQWSMAVEGSRITKWSLDYGPHLVCKRGSVVRSPRWVGFFLDSDDPFAPWPFYNAILRQKGVFKNPHAPRPDWWADLNYVTWGDQHVYANGQRTQTYRQTETNLSEETVNRWLGIVEKARLPFKTITIDGYWCRWIGEWVADESRFPDLRRLVDELHARGYKVVFWYCPFEAETNAPIFKSRPDLFLDDSEARNNCQEQGLYFPPRPRYDFTQPAARSILRDDIRRMLSPEPGCYNGDGLKLDFFPNAPNAISIPRFHDPSWGLGHRFVHKTSAMIYRWAKQFKPDCRIDGESGNPFFADYTDSMRAWDWCHPDYAVYNDRVRLASAICPGVPALYDEHIYFKNLYRYAVRSAVARPIFFNVEWFHGDLVKPTTAQLKHLAAILQVVAKLNARARDMRVEDMASGEIHDAHGRLIGRVSADDTILTCCIEGVLDVVLVNETDKTQPMAAAINPAEFGAPGRTVTISRVVPAMSVVRVTRDLSGKRRGS